MSELYSKSKYEMDVNRYKRRMNRYCNDVSLSNTSDGKDER